MPRPRKWRKVCCLPENKRFGPLEPPGNAESVINMAVDEYETIRLIDLEGFTQEECASQMNIARTTVQGIYSEARKKVAEALVNGKVLFIAGGEYRLCDETGKTCGAGCRRHQYGRDAKGITAENREENKMRKIAVASENGLVTEHFGHCESFMIFVVEANQIVQEDTIPNPGHKPGFLPNFLADIGVRVIISGSMGAGAREIFTEKGIEVIVGATGNAKTVAEQYLQGKLQSTNSVCHQHQHHDECGH